MQRPEHQQHEYEINLDDEPIDDYETFAQSQQQDELMTKLKSTVTKRKGRGFSSAQASDTFEGIRRFERLPEEVNSDHAQRSIEGWSVFLRNVPQECPEDALKDLCLDFGPVKDLRLPLDHRTGYVKGHAIVEWGNWREAKEAIEGLNGLEWMGNVLEAGWAFVKAPEVYGEEHHQELRSTRPSIRRH